MSHPGGLAWRMAIGAGLLLAVALATFLAFAAMVVAAPFATVEVPAACNGAVSRLPTNLAVSVPGAGTGTLLAGDAGTQVVIATDYGATPAATTAYIVRRSDGEVLQRLAFRNDIAVAAIDHGVVYLFNDKLGYQFRASDGARIGHLIESDNYRGLFTSGGTRYLQMNADFYMLDPGGSVFSRRHVDFAGIADGCYFPAPAGER